MDEELMELRDRVKKLEVEVIALASFVTRKVLEQWISLTALAGAAGVDEEQLERERGRVNEQTVEEGYERLIAELRNVRSAAAVGVDLGWQKPPRV